MNFCFKFQCKLLKIFFCTFIPVLKVLSNKDNGFSGFSEIYASTLKKRTIKGWKFHKKNTLNLIVIEGRAKFVTYDQEKDLFEEAILGKPKHLNGFKGEYKRITIPSQTWFAFQNFRIYIAS